VRLVHETLSSVKLIVPACCSTGSFPTPGAVRSRAANSMGRRKSIPWWFTAMPLPRGAGLVCVYCDSGRRSIDCRNVIIRDTMQGRIATNNNNNNNMKYDAGTDPSQPLGLKRRPGHSIGCGRSGERAENQVSTRRGDQAFAPKPCQVPSPTLNLEP